MAARLVKLVALLAAATLSVGRRALELARWILVCLGILASFPAQAQVTFTDDFNRPDGAVGNGWFSMAGNIGGNLVIRNGALTTPLYEGGSAGIYRPLDLSGSIRFAATITDENGFSGLLKRYTTHFGVGGDGGLNRGYEVVVYRGDQNYANSAVFLQYNGAQLDVASSTFQFGPSLSVDVTFNPDGSVGGNISGDGATFTFSFGARQIPYLGQNAFIQLDFPDTRTSTFTYPTVDDLSIATTPTAPTAVAGVNQATYVGRTVYLDGSASFAPNTPSASLQYAWTLMSRPSASAAVLTGASIATPSFFDDAPGTFVLQLVVTDPSAGLSSAPSQVTVSSTWVAPAANPGPAVSSIVGSQVTLDGTASIDPNGLPLSYAWSLLVKPSGSAAQLSTPSDGYATLTPDVTGSYSVGLVVSDRFGNSPQATVAVSAITPGDFAQGRISCALNYIAGMPASQFQAPGHRNSLSNFALQAITAIQGGNTSIARQKLNDAIVRTDGYPRRGALDGPGPGLDWIVDPTAQFAVYQCLSDALAVL